MTASPVAAVSADGGQLVTQADEGAQWANVFVSALDSTLPADCALCSSSTLTISVDPGGSAKISFPCDAGTVLCSSQIRARLKVPAWGYEEYQTAVCSTGSGCPTHPWGVSKADSYDETFVATGTVNHGVLGSASVQFEICGWSWVYKDTDGDGEFHDNLVYSDFECDTGTVTVGGL